MSQTVADIFGRAIRRIGGITGTLGTVTVGGTDTTAVLNGLINTTGDNQGFPSGDRLIFPESATGSQETLVKQWDDPTGLATFLNLGSAPVAAHPYFAVNREDYTLNEMVEAWKEALRESRRTYRQVIPITPNLNEYPLTVCDWLRGGADVDGAWINQSPLWLHNEGFSLWQNGAAAVPDGYALSGTTPTVTRVNTGIRSTYAAQITAGVDTARLTQGIPYSLSQWLTKRTAAVFTPLRAAAWVSTTDASAVRVFIRYTESASGSPVTTYAYSDYVTANGQPQFVALSLTPTATMDAFTWGIEVLATKSFTVGAAVFMQNTTDAPNSFSIRDQGSQAYYDAPIQHAVRNVGQAPVVELASPIYVLQQLVVYTRRPFPAYSSLADVVEDEYARSLEFGLLSWLLINNKPNQDRARLDIILRQAQTAWARFLDNTADLPVPDPPQQVQVGPA